MLRIVFNKPKAFLSVFRVYLKKEKEELKV